MRQKGKVTLADPNMWLRAGFVFDTRMPKFQKFGGRCGVWRVRSFSGVGNPLINMVTTGVGGQKVLHMNVARYLRPGDLCSPVKLALEYDQWCAKENERRAFALAHVSEIERAIIMESPLHG